jgi:hypothetical protein
LAVGYGIRKDGRLSASDRPKPRCENQGWTIALEQVSLLDDGRVRYRLKRPWPRPGGITELVLEPVDFLEG